MKSTIFSAVLFAAGAFAQSFSINTPIGAVVCQPLLISWIGGTGPYFLSILPGNQPGAAALVDLGRQDGNSVTWTVNVAAGTSLGLTIRDSSGATAQSAAFTPNAGTDTSCVGQNPSSAGGSSSSGTTPSSSASSSSGSSSTVIPVPSSSAPPSTVGTTSAGTTPSTTSSRATSSSGSSAASSSSAAATGNAAVGNLAQAGVAGVVGAAIVALLA
ncbi:hypothetical protein BDQ12DRAFT_772610 [Crucibulum laeve]|uniref:Ser-Thr-rich glycosyl-phosphatidyl-inositol-anchored membrane family-domain-containing protein n=1 Tax=Crucibulum laeve TaxID=68775 RepID=A0A5C3M4Y2_9AGAR|nr:hypothetical protein BDQ12DRAFT_772610 [Crucibulum laeve]